MNNVKEIEIKSCAYYFLNVMINIKNPYPNKTKVDIYSYFYLLHWIRGNK